jgi:UTP--glucose-1-phosphate uridylyltransferase
MGPSLANTSPTCSWTGGDSVEKDLWKITSLVEKPEPAQAPSRLAIPGRYILTPDIFEILAHTKPSVGGEIQLTDALATLAQKKQMFAYRFAGTRFDAGDRVGYLKASLHYALKRPELRPQLLEWLEDLVGKK